MNFGTYKKDKKKVLHKFLFHRLLFIYLSKIFSLRESVLTTTCGCSARNQIDYTLRRKFNTTLKYNFVIFKKNIIDTLMR